MPAVESEKLKVAIDIPSLSISQLYQFHISVHVASCTAALLNFHVLQHLAAKVQMAKRFQEEERLQLQFKILIFLSRLGLKYKTFFIGVCIAIIKNKMANFIVQIQQQK